MRLSGYPLALAGSLLSLAVAAVLERTLGLDQPALIFLLGVFVVATRSSIGPALLAAVLGVLIYNMLFLEPRYSLHIASGRDAVTAGAFFVAALLAGRLGSRLSSQVQALQAANLRAAARQQLARGLLAANSEAALAAAVAEVFRERLGAGVALEIDARTIAPLPAHDAPGEASARLDPATSVERRLVLPPPHAGRLVLCRHDGRPLQPAQAAMLDDLVDDVSQAVLRLQLAAELESQRVANETERLRSALLASVSHDLRSPLAGIIGAAGSLEAYADQMSEQDRRSLLETIRLEGERLDRYIQNLLDMTRLGHSTLPLARDWIGVDELLGAAIGRAHRQWPAARFEVAIDPAIGPIWVHAALIEQALFNIIENAVSFSPPGAPVSVQASIAADGRLQIDVVDHGPGIPEAERERIFDMFFSVERGDRGRSGTGLGLAICRGMLGAHGGEVQAGPGPDGRGTCMRVLLPLLEPSR